MKRKQKQKRMLLIGIVILTILTIVGISSYFYMGKDKVPSNLGVDLNAGTGYHEIESGTVSDEFYCSNFGGTEVKKCQVRVTNPCDIGVCYSYSGSSCQTSGYEKCDGYTDYRCRILSGDDSWSAKRYSCGSVTTANPGRASISIPSYIGTSAGYPNSGWVDVTFGSRIYLQGSTIEYKKLVYYDCTLSGLAVAGQQIYCEGNTPYTWVDRTNDGCGEPNTLDYKVYGSACTGSSTCVDGSCHCDTTNPCPSGMLENEFVCEEDNQYRQCIKVGGCLQLSPTPGSCGSQVCQVKTDKTQIPCSCQPVTKSGIVCDNSTPNKDICVTENNQKKIYSCQIPSGSSCYTWVSVETCNLDQDCKINTNNQFTTDYYCGCPTCQMGSPNICTADLKGYQICNVGSSTCKTYSTPINCLEGQVCDGGSCKYQNQCQLSDVGCEINEYGVFKTKCICENGNCQLRIYEGGECDSGDTCSNGECISEYTIDVTMKTLFALDEDIILDVKVNGKIDGGDSAGTSTQYEIYSVEDTQNATFSGTGSLNMWGKESIRWNKDTSDWVSLPDGYYHLVVTILGENPKSKTIQFSVNQPVNINYVCVNPQYKNKLIECLVEITDKSSNPIQHSNLRLTYTATINNQAISTANLITPKLESEGQYKISANTNSRAGDLVFSVKAEVTGLLSTTKKSLPIQVQANKIEITPTFPESGAKVGLYTINFETKDKSGQYVNTISSVTIKNPDDSTSTISSDDISGNNGKYSFKYEFTQPSAYYVKIVSSATGIDIGSTCPDSPYGGCSLSFSGGSGPDPIDYTSYFIVGGIILGVVVIIYFTTRRKK